MAFYNCIGQQELLPLARNDEGIQTTTHNSLQNAAVEPPPPSNPRGLIKINSHLRFYSYHVFIAQMSFPTHAQNSPEKTGLFYISILTKVGYVFFITLFIFHYLYQ